MVWYVCGGSNGRFAVVPADWHDFDGAAARAEDELECMVTGIDGPFPDETAANAHVADLLGEAWHE